MIVVTDKAGRLKRIVFATCLQVALYCFYLGNANAQTGPAMPQVLSEQRVTPFMFKGAHHCFRYCSGRKVRFGEEHMAVRYNFVDFLSTSDWGQSAFVALLERSEEHTSELQSLMRISYAVFCLTNKNN